MTVHIAGVRQKIEDIDAFLAEIKQFAVANGVSIQVFNASRIFGKEHIESAVFHAKRAFQIGTNTAQNLETEVLLYTAGERQISKALRLVGIYSGIEEMAVVMIGGDEALFTRLLSVMKLKRDDTILSSTEKDVKSLGIRDDGLHAPQDLVLEKVALLDLKK